MAFVPPTFANLGKSSSDLFKKKFDDKKDFKNVVKAVVKSSSGIVFTTGGEFDAKNNLTGNLKVSNKTLSFGELTGELSTAGPAKVELKLKKLAKGLSVTITGDTAAAYSKGKGKFAAPTLKAATEYSKDFFTGSASAETAFTSTNILVGSAVIGFEGLSVGGEVKLDTAAITDVEDYNVGAEYQGVDFTATLKTANQGEDLTASYVTRASPELTVGGQFITKLDGSDDRSAGLATEYRVDANTAVKLRGDTKKVVAVAVEHRLANPRVLVGVASSWNIVGFSAPNPKDFGVSLVFADYDADK